MKRNLIIALLIVLGTVNAQEIIFSGYGEPINPTAHLLMIDVIEYEDSTSNFHVLQYSSDGDYYGIIPTKNFYAIVEYAVLHSHNGVLMETTVRLATEIKKDGGYIMYFEPHMTYKDDSILANSITIYSCPESIWVRTIPINKTVKWEEPIHTITPTEKIDVYPNPCTDIINLSHAMDVYIYNEVGILVMYKESTNQIDVSTLTPGGYIIQVGTYTSRIIKI